MSAAFSSLRCQTVSLEAPEYQEMLALRDQVLRRPLGLVLTPHDTELDPSAVRVVAKIEERVVGCCLLTLESGTCWRLRAMAVEPALHRQGVGRAVVAFAEAEARRGGAAELVLDARMTALEFYRRLAFEAEGPEFVKVGIPHRLMRKRL